VTLQLYGELKQNKAVDQAKNWHTETKYNKKEFSLLRFAIGSVEPLIFQCGFLCFA